MDTVPERLIAWLLRSVSRAVLFAGFAMLVAGGATFSMLSGDGVPHAIAVTLLQIGADFALTGAAATWLSQSRAALLPNELATAADSQRPPPRLADRACRDSRRSASLAGVHAAAVPRGVALRAWPARDAGPVGQRERQHVGRGPDTAGGSVDAAVLRAGDAGRSRCHVSDAATSTDGAQSAVPPFLSRMRHAVVGARVREHARGRGSDARIGCAETARQHHKRQRAGSGNPSPSARALRYRRVDGAAASVDGVHLRPLCASDRHVYARTPDVRTAPAAIGLHASGSIRPVSYTHLTLPTSDL